MSMFNNKEEDARLLSAHLREEEDLAHILSEKYNVPYTDLSITPVDMEGLRLVSEKDAREAEAVVFNKVGKKISLASLRPTNPNVQALQEKLAARGFTVIPYIISRHSLEKAWERYKDLSFATESKAGVFDISGERMQEVAKTLHSLADVRTYIESGLQLGKLNRVSHILEGLLGGGFALHASDIHIEPEEEGVRLRLRLDGVLTDVLTFDHETFHLLTSRLKLLSGLKLNVDSRAQDGRFSVVVQDREVEIRASLIPGAYGESIVLRLLDPESIQAAFESLGIYPALLARIEKEIRRPNGMLLTTGPTGSGKTTTLYAFLRKIHTPDVKIITIEDPVEYHLPGIVQTQVDGEAFTFATGLRSALRQDPDVIMVGEIRDAEVATTAVQAALTGHMVFSTLHTNTAAGAFPRLADLGIDPKTFASAITMVLAQRLVRTLDPDRRKKVPLSGEEKVIVDRILATITDQTLIPTDIDHVWEPVPDEQTGATGYRGRIGLYEGIVVDVELGEFLRNNPSEHDIADHVRRQGFLTMEQDGVLKALAGITTLDEVRRVVDLERSS